MKKIKDAEIATIYGMRMIIDAYEDYLPLWGGKIRVYIHHPTLHTCGTIFQTNKLWICTDADTGYRFDHTESADRDLSLLLGYVVLNDYGEYEYYRDVDILRSRKGGVINAKV